MLLLLTLKVAEFFFFFFLGQTVVLGHICVGTMSSGLLYCIYVTGASLVWLRRLRILLQCRRHEFSPWVGKISWRRKWQPTPVFLPGKSHGQKSLVGYSPWCSKRLDRPEWLTLRFSSVQLLSHVQLFSTPWTAAHHASLSITNSWS